MPGRVKRGSAVWRAERADQMGRAEGREGTSGRARCRQGRPRNPHAARNAGAKGDTRVPACNIQPETHRRAEPPAPACMGEAGSSGPPWSTALTGLLEDGSHPCGKCMSQGPSSTILAPFPLCSLRFPTKQRDAREDTVASGSGSGERRELGMRLWTMPLFPSFRRRTWGSGGGPTAS